MQTTDSLLLVGDEFGPALAALSALVELDFDGSLLDCGITFEPMQPVIAACMQLASLQDVGLRIAGVTAALVEDLVGAGGALKTVRVFMDAFADEEEGGEPDEVHYDIQARYPAVDIDVVDAVCY